MYFGVEFKYNLVIINDLVLSLNELIKMPIVKYSYRKYQLKWTVIF